MAEAPPSPGSEGESQLTIRAGAQGPTLRHRESSSDLEVRYRNYVSVLTVSWCKKMNRSHTQTDREQQLRDTHTRQEQHPDPPNEHPSWGATVPPDPWSLD